MKWDRANIKLFHAIHYFLVAEKIMFYNVANLLDDPGMSSTELLHKQRKPYFTRIEL